MRALIIATLVAASASMSARQSQTRDAAGPPTGTGVIAGVVVSDDGSARPIGRALVTLNGGDIRLQPATLTNSEGGFVFTNLPAGRFTIMVSKPGYVTNYYGARHPRMAALALPIVITDGLRVTGVQVRLPHGAAISGTLRDQYGRPQPDVQIIAQLVRPNGQPGPPAPGDSASARSDDRGMFRVSGLTAGSYVLSAFVAGFLGPMNLVSNDDVQAPERASIPHDVGFATVYYPGVVDRAEASAVTVAAGEDRSGADMTLRVVPVVKIAGTVMGPDGQPAGVARDGVGIAEVRLTDAGPPGSMSRIWIVRPDRNGRFTFSGISPGRYTVTSHASSTGQQPASGDLWAAQDVTVDGSDAADLLLALQPGLNVSGRIIFDGASQRPTVRLGLTSETDPRISTQAATIDNDGHFSIVGVPPGQYRFDNFGQASGNWTLRSAIVNARNVVDLPFDLRPSEPIEGVVVTFSDRKTEISGRLLDAAGRPAPEYYVMVFSADRALWTPRSRAVRAPVRVDTTGHYLVSGLPAGDYFICALPDFDPAGWSDPSQLEQLTSVSIKITLREGESKTQDLKLGG